VRAQVLFQTGGWPWLQRLLQVSGGGLHCVLAPMMDLRAPLVAAVYALLNCLLGQCPGEWLATVHTLQVLSVIAKKHGTSASNVATKWVLGRPAVPAVIVGARNASHVADHQQLFSFQLDA
jgi:hypothetical protein